MQRAGRLVAQPLCLWLTGLPASGKSTLSGVVTDMLRRDLIPVYALDGDHVRLGLNRDLGFDPTDRAESARRVGEVARLMVDAGLVAVVSLISPFQAHRDAARSLFEPGTFVEVHVDTPLNVCECRDPKGHYQKARSGELSNFTGVSSVYEEPLSPEIHLKFDGSEPEVGASQILAYLRQSGLLSAVGDGRQASPKTPLLEPSVLVPATAATPRRLV